MQLTITYLDDSPKLKADLPLVIDLIRMLPGPDRPDYWLAKLHQPVCWSVGGQRREVTHLVVATRFVGARIRPGVGRVLINIACVIDPSLLDDASLEFAKAIPIDFGEAQVVD